MYGFDDSHLSVGSGISPRKSQLLDAVERRRSDIIRSERAVYVALASSLSAALLYYDIFHYGLIDKIFAHEGLTYIFIILETIIGIAFLVSATYEILLHMWPHVWMKPIVIPSSYKKLLGIRDEEVGFKIVADHKISSLNYSNISSGSITPRGGPIDGQLNSTSINSHSSKRSPITLPPFKVTTPNVTFNSSITAHNNSFNDTSRQNSFNQSYNNSSSSFLKQHSSQSPSLTSPSASLSHHSPVTSLRQRLSNSNKSPITDRKSLDKYLREYHESEQELEQMREAESKQQQISTIKVWNFGQSLTMMEDLSLDEMTYQPATN